MDAAKEVVTGLIGQLPAGVQAGLMAYGHRQRKDCKDIELLIPVGPIQPDAFTQKVQSLQPLGETPISASIRQAADALKGLKGKKTVIPARAKAKVSMRLVPDQDPGRILESLRAYVQKLSTPGIRVSVHDLGQAKPVLTVVGGRAVFDAVLRN